jgi:hypothetical protein
MPAVKSAILVYLSMRLLSAISFALICLSFFSCTPRLTPLNNDYETAKSLGKGNFEVSGNLTEYSPSNNWGSLYAGGRIGFGITQNFDLKLRYEHGDEWTVGEGATKESFKGNYIGLVPKISFSDNRFGFRVPVGIYNQQHTVNGTKNRSSIFSITPTFTRTFFTPKKDNRMNADFSISVKGDYQNFSDASLKNEFNPGITIGAGVSRNLSKWALRPEVGYMFRKNNNTWSAGLAFVFTSF